VLLWLVIKARRYASVCLLHAGMVPKRANAGSRNQRHTLAQGGTPVYWRQTSRRKSDGSPKRGAKHR